MADISSDTAAGSAGVAVPVWHTISSSAKEEQAVYNSEAGQAQTILIN